MKVAALIELALRLVGQAGQVSQLIARARAEGRDEISDEDLNAVVGSDDGARQRLVDAIATAEAEGR